MRWATIATAIFAITPSVGEASQADCTITWTATTDTRNDLVTPGVVAGYIVLGGISPGIWTQLLDVGDTLTATCTQFTQLPDNNTFYFSIRAYDDVGNISPHVGSEIVGTPDVIVRQ